MPNTIPTRDIMPGDLLLHAGTGQISKLIKWVSDSDYSHVGLVFDTGFIAEAVSPKVRLNAPLEPRIKDEQHQFQKIDVLRPLNGGQPLPAAALKALQESARRLEGQKFAVNQMFELGLICLVKNKAPPNAKMKLLLWWLFDRLLPSDPDQLVCSEFVYRSLRDANPPPPTVLTPVLVATDPKPRPFPSDINWFKLWEEYRKASGKAAPKAKLKPKLASTFKAAAKQVPELPPPPPPGLVITDEQLEQARQAARIRFLASRTAASAAVATAGGLPLPDPNPELILPQDLADSPSFVAMGRAVP